MGGSSRRRLFVGGTMLGTERLLGAYKVGSCPRRIRHFLVLLLLLSLTPL
jgi:hypothetical protein